jgi:uncharacterized membrane protein
MMIGLTHRLSFPFEYKTTPRAPCALDADSASAPSFHRMNHTAAVAALCHTRLAYPQFQENPVRSVFGDLLRHLQRNMLAGLITIGPLFVTWLVFSFVVGRLGNAIPGDWIEQPWLQSILAVLLTLVVLYAVGRITSLVVGRQAFNLFEAVLERLPVVAKVYTSVRQLLDTMMAKKESSQRVVLIDFPIEGQKSVGFLTRTLTDSTTGRELAAVLLPNAINPTSAFLQVLPIERVTETDLTMEQAMSMLMTGGAVSPESIRFTRTVDAKAR